MIMIRDLLCVVSAGVHETKAFKKNSFCKYQQHFRYKLIIIIINSIIINDTTIEESLKTTFWKIVHKNW